MDVKFEETFRSDEKGRRVQVQFISRDGKMDWIRVTTFLENGTKFRSDYYKDEKPETFEKVRKAEKKMMMQRNINELNRQQSLHTSK